MLTKQYLVLVISSIKLIMPYAGMAFAVIDLQQTAV